LKTALWRTNLTDGRGTLGCLFSLFLVAGLGYLGYKFLPHYVSHFQLKDAMTDIAVRHAAGTLGSSRDAKAVKDAVLAKAQELDIPLRREDIEVRQTEEKVFINVKYIVPVELPGRVYDLKFEFTGNN
jgi:hypothetical protein